jgi:hypothetical protein
MSNMCPKCGAKMQAGVATAQGTIGEVVADSVPRFVFVIPGATVSRNPIKAFKQGLAEREFPIKGMRCSKCGFLELFAVDETSS